MLPMLRHGTVAAGEHFFMPCLRGASSAGRFTAAHGMNSMKPSCPGQNMTAAGPVAEHRMRQRLSSDEKTQT